MPLTPEEVELLQALSGDVTKAERDRMVNRLRELHVPRLDAVDAGAVRHTFLIRKSESEQETDMADLGDKITKDEDVTKMEMSGEAKAEALKILQAASEKLTALIGMVKQAAEGGEGSGYPDEMKKACGDVAKEMAQLSGGEKSEKSADAEKMEDGEEEKEKAEAKKEDDAENDVEKMGEGKDPEAYVRKEDGSLDLGDGVVVGGTLAKAAEEMIQKAGRTMSKKNLGELRKAMATMLNLWKSVDPDQGEQMKALMADITKRFADQDESTEKILKSLADLSTKVEAQQGAPAPRKVADGNAQDDAKGEEIKKSSPALIPYGADMSDPRHQRDSGEGHYFGLVNKD